MTQTEAILAHLEKGYSLTSLQALDLFGCFRLGARIWDLKREGWEIESRMLKLESGKRVALYWLKDDERTHANKVLAANVACI